MFELDMSRWMLHSMLFFGGLGLAGMVVYAVNVAFDSEPTAVPSYRGSELAPILDRSAARMNEAAQKRSSDITPSGRSPRSAFGSHPLGKEPEVTARSRIRDALARGESLEELQGALDLQSPEALSLIASEFIDSIPESNTTIMPLMRKWALDRLISRMDDADWSRWPQAGRPGHPSLARKYIDDIGTVHTSLAAYLETAAWLLYDLHTATYRGEPYDAAAGLQRLLQSAEAELRSRSDPLSLRLTFTPLILLDPTFASRLEVERCRLVSDVLPLQSRSLEAELRLIISLDAQKCDPSTYSKVAETIEIVVQSRDDRLRRALLGVEERTRALALFAAGDDRVRAALAELYAITAVSELERGNSSLARSYLVESLGLKPGLRSQAFLEDFFRQTSLDPSLQQRRELYFEPAAEVTAESVSWFFSGLLILLIATPIVWLFRRLYFTVPAIQSTTPQLATFPAKKGGRSFDARSDGGGTLSRPATHKVSDGPDDAEEDEGAVKEVINDRPRLIQSRNG